MYEETKRVLKAKIKGQGYVNHKNIVINNNEMRNEEDNFYALLIEYKHKKYLIPTSGVETKSLPFSKFYIYECDSDGDIAYLYFCEEDFPFCIETKKINGGKFWLEKF